MYKRIFKYLKNVESFQNLSEEQAINFIYLEKQKCIPIYVLCFFIDRKLVLKALTIFMFVLIANLAVIIPLYILKLVTNPIIVTIEIVTIVIAYFYLICLLYVSAKLHGKKADEWKEEFTNIIQNKLSKIFLLNHKVISRKSWNILKKDKKLYSYLRSNEKKHHCYDISCVTACRIKDPKVKILWIGATSVVDGHKFGHAVLKKGEYIYDTNECGTYKYERYIEAYQAEIFKEYSIEQYKNGELFKDWDLFLQWCKERGIRRSRED